MANTSQTIFQRLGTIFSGRNSVSPIMTKLPPTFDSVASNQVLYSTKDRNDYERKLNQYKQQKLLSYQWVKAGVDNSIESLAGLNAVKLMYRDADLMDGMPEIGAALDILSEEACLVGETKIKLLNGKTETIENLYKNKCANFWVYSVDESGICRPSCVEKVIYKGEKEVIKITLDDGTIVRCTPDHKLMLSDCSWKEAKDLAFGDSLMSIYDDINYLGYEQIKSTVENKKRLTHRIVAENVLRDDGYKDYRDLKKNLYNHRVTSVEIENSKEKVYDLLNSSTNNCFGIKCNNGQVISHNCAMKSNGKMLNVYSKSKRVKAILEDLFVNRLHIHTDLPMIARATLKYGNQFMLLNIDEENGILGWKQLPVYEIDRVENGYTTSPSAGAIPINAADIRPDKTRFIWVGHNESTPYEDWQMAHFRLLKDSFFLPYGCIVGDTRIETENGYKEIDSISIGDRIWTFDVNKQEKVLATVSMGMFKGIKDVYSVKTRHNFIEGTSDHKLLCYEDNQLKYKEIKDIKVGDLLVIDNSNNKSNVSIKIDKSPLTEMEANLKKSIQWWTNYINYIPDYVDEEFANFLGFMYGDGWLDGNRVCFATGEYDSFNKKYVDYLEKITNKKAYFRKNEHKINYDIQQALVTSKCLAIILRRMGFSGKFNEKRVPEWLYSCNDKIKKAFLDGLMTADGSYNIDKFNVLRCSIELSNEQLIKDIKMLVQSLGYKSGQILSRNRCNKVRKPLSNGHIIKTKSTSYYFYYFESQNKQEKKYDVVNRKNDGFKTEKVLSNEYVGKKKTYDITVDNNNSNFFANGIVTHNCSHLHKARRAWRMWSMMEDAMLIYRLDKSIERRVFKIYVGSIDDQDVPAFIQQVADNFKRTPVIDPLTGQIDLRKNFLDVSSDYFIPVRDPSAPTPIENLTSAQNPTSMDDINYMQNKVFSALRVPKQFLNFQEAQGKGQNLSLLDVRFARMVNTLQQFLLLELNKIAMIHLHLLGLDDDIMNFTLSLNNPSAQIEALELEDLTKRVNTATQALADPGIGMPLMSLHMVLKKIMKLTDSEIKDMLNEIRLEKAMAAELANTAAIIKKTGMFDAVDNIYGDYDAMNDPNASAQQPGMGNENGMGMGMSGGGAIGGGGGGFDGGALTFDSLEGGGDMGGSMGDINGTEATTDMSNAPNLDAGKPNESKDKNKPLLNEARSKFFNSAKSFTQRYFDLLSELERRDNGNEEELANIEGKVTTINEQIGNLFTKIDAILEENSNPYFSKTVEDNDDETISSPSTSITESDLDNELLSNE